MGLDPSSRQHPLATIGPAALVLDAGHNSNIQAMLFLSL